MDFCDNSDSLAVDFSGNLYCGCRNLYHGSGDVGGNRDPGFIHIQKVDLSRDWVKYVLLALICAISAVMAAFFVFSCCAYLCIAALSAVQYRERMTLWVTYAVNDVTMTLSMLAGFYHGICDLNLLLGSNHTRDWYMEQWGGRNNAV